MKAGFFFERGAQQNTTTPAGVITEKSAASVNIQVMINIEPQLSKHT